MATFVGRHAELASLVGAVTGAASGGGVTVGLVQGPPGSGKSRLLQEAATAAALPHRFRVCGHEPEQAVPLAAASDLLRELARRPEGTSLGELGFVPNMSDGMASELDALRVFEATYQSLRRVQPALLMIDDVQWIDQQTRALCHYVVRAAQAARQQLAVLVASRGPDASTFVGGLAGLADPQRVVRITLDPLSLDDGLLLIGEIHPDTARDAAVALWERAAGSPFWLEVLAGADDGGLTEVLDDRLRGCTAAATRLLAAVVLAGRPLPVTTLAEATSLPEEALRPAVQELTARGLAIEQATTLSVGHDLIREAAAATIPPELARELHERLARWVDSLGGDDLTLLLAGLRHRQAAGLPVADLGLRLLRSGQRRLIGRDGLEELGQLVDGVDPADPRALELQEELATLSAALGDNRSSLRRWAWLYERLDEPATRARAALAASKVAYDLQDADGAWSFLERARGLAPADPVVAIVADARAAAVRRWLEQRRDNAAELTGRVVAAARRLAADASGELGAEERRAVLSAFTAAYDAATLDDDATEMLRIAEEIIDVARTSDERALVRGLLMSALALRFLGRPRQAELRLGVAIAEAERRVLPKVLVTATYWLARTLHDQGRLTEADRVAADAAALVSRFGHLSPMWPRIDRLRAWIRLSTGDWQQALAAMAAVAADDPDPHFRLDAHLVTATWLGRLHPDRAADIVMRVTAARTDAEAAGCRRCRRQTDLEGAIALARSGALDDAHALVGPWRDEPPRDDLSAFWQQRAEGILTAAQDPAAGVATLDAAADDAGAMGLGLEALWTRLDIGRVLATHDTDRAVRTYEQALAQARACEAVTERRFTESALRELGVRTWGRGPKIDSTDEPWAVLSEREREVVRLVAGGASNPEVAAALFVSRRTVERHVSSILAKTGARNRTELAAPRRRRRGWRTSPMNP